MKSIEVLTNKKQTNKHFFTLSKRKIKIEWNLSNLFPLKEEKEILGTLGKFGYLKHCAYSGSLHNLLRPDLYALNIIVNSKIRLSAVRTWTIQCIKYYTQK